MSWFGWPKTRRRKSHNSRRPRATQVRAFEALEPRSVPAVLGLGIRVLEDNGGVPGNPRTTPIAVGETFWVQVLAEDQRAAAPGVIGLPLNLSWDSDNLELLTLPDDPGGIFPNPLSPASLLTSDFPLNRFLDDFAASGGHTGFVEPPAAPVAVPANPNLENLRGASLPLGNIGQAIGDDPTDAADFGFFSQLRFRALAPADDTPFTLQLAGSMSFADAAALDNVAVLSAAVIQDRDDTDAPEVAGSQGPELAVTEFIEIVAAPAVSSLSGFVYADTNLNGVFDTSATGVPLEIGLPGVTITLFRAGQAAAVATTTTGPDGWYHFEDLASGTYRIVETQPATYVNSLNSLGRILADPANGGGSPPNAAQRRGIVGADEFSQIELRGGEHGIDYNFGENVIPTKNLLRARSIPRVALNAQLGLATAVVSGTAASDQIDVQMSAGEIAVTINGGATQFFDRSAVDIVLIDALAGQDAVTIAGSDDPEVAHLLPEQAALRVGDDYLGSNYGLLAVNVGQVECAAGAAGIDLAVIRDTQQTSDALVTALNTATLTTAAGRLAQVIDFDRVRAITTLAIGGLEDDTVDRNAVNYVLQLAGSWRDI